MDYRALIAGCSGCAERRAWILGKLRAAIDPGKAINLVERSATQRLADADLIGAAVVPEPECLQNTLEIQSNAEINGLAWVIRQKAHGELPGRYADADVHIPFITRTLAGPTTGFASADDSADTTLEVCQGALTLDTPDGWRRLSASMGSGPSDANLNIIRLDIKDNSFTGGVTSFGVVGRVLLAAKCVDDPFEFGENVERIWTDTQIEEVMPGSTGSLGSANFGGSRDICGGGTLSGDFTRTQWRFIEPSTRSEYQNSTVTELAGQATITAWENQGSRPVIDFADIPQATDVETGCLTAKGGAWYAHGIPGTAAAIYEWQYYTSGLASQPWTVDESVIIRNGEPWPECIVPV